jgi:hypothetical protein
MNSRSPAAARLPLVLAATALACSLAHAQVQPPTRSAPASVSPSVGKPSAPGVLAPQFELKPEPPRADLRLAPMWLPGGTEGAPYSGVCATGDQHGPSKQLWVHMKNQGAVASGPFTMKVRYANGQEVVEFQPAGLAAGQMVLWKPNLPPFGSGPQMGFQVTIDATNTVIESSEGNNTLVGFCLNPGN